MCDEQIETIIQQVQEARKRKRPTLLNIYVVGGLIQIMEAHLIYDNRQVDRHSKNGYPK